MKVIHLFECNNLPDLLTIFLVLISFICRFLNYALGILKDPWINVFIRGTGLCVTSSMLNRILPNSKKIIWREAHKIKNKWNKQQFCFSSSFLKQVPCWFCKLASGFVFLLGSR